MANEKITYFGDFLGKWMEEGKKANKISAEFLAYPEPKDIITRGGEFYAVWDDERGLWNTSKSYCYAMIDAYIESLTDPGTKLFARNSSTKVVDRFNHYCKDILPEIYIDGHALNLNEKLTFKSDAPNRECYASQRLDYDICEGDYSSFDKIMSTLYDPDERHKIEWCIGSIFAGDSVTLQKFLVLYGPAGAGKSTVLNIVEQLFKGYTGTFDAKALGQSNNAFSLECFKNNPLVAIQHDGDLSKIIDNTKLNSLVSHETMMINPKYGKQYACRFNSFLMLGTNTPVRITDQKSGLLRRLIDCKPSGRKLTREEYNYHTKQIKFELGAIAYYCRKVYLDNPAAYDDYRPVEMISTTNDFYNFVLDNFNQLNQDEVSLAAAYTLYKQYNEEGNMECITRTKFREELKNYYATYENNRFKGFITSIFEKKEVKKVVKKVKKVPDWLQMVEQKSAFDELCEDCPAQYTTAEGLPKSKWDNVKSTLGELDTSILHFVKVPINHIVIDLDKKGEDGKSLEKNIEAAEVFPPTYAEVSKSGGGLHLHYIYDGDPEELSSVYGDNIEIKVFKGNTSLRRKLTICNNLAVAHINSGLPLKVRKEGAMLDTMKLEDERHLRNLVEKALRKEIPPYSTVCNMQFIQKCLDDAYADPNLFYDLSDLSPEIMNFALGSTNQSDKCLKMIPLLRLAKENPAKSQFKEEDPNGTDEDIIFYDVEVFPNLFVVCYKRNKEGSTIVSMINPTATDMKRFMEYKLVGFNNIAYDNHIIYACSLGYTNAELYELSKGIVSGEQRGFAQAKHISYTDIYDFASKKQSLKKWEIEMGIRHLELGLPWDKPVPEELWQKVGEYCCNDVDATAKLFAYLRSDWIGRKILADISGLTCNHSTNDHSKEIVFPGIKDYETNPNLVYTDLKTGQRYYDGVPYESKVDPNIIQAFPDYEYVKGEDGKWHNMHRGRDMSFGGLVRVEEGYYENVYLLDIASMHPTSMEQLDIFGPYTERFNAIKKLRIEIKHKNYDNVAKMFDGKLVKYLDDKESLDGCKQALKMVINPVYGLTSAAFKNRFRDERNINNIVALRGALFMDTLWDEVIKLGYHPIHIKTDSIKIANGDDFIRDFCMDFARKYGYEFEHEATYDKFCIVNKAVYIAHSCYGDHCGEWTATGAQFAVPYVFKTLFSKEEIKFEDMCETFSVKKGDIYLDFNENLSDVTQAEKMRDKYTTQIKKGEESLIAERESLAEEINSGHNYSFVGRVGQFTPIKDGKQAGVLRVIRSLEDTKRAAEKPSSVSGADGYRWYESAMVSNMFDNGVLSMDDIDRTFYMKLVDDARDAIGQYVDPDIFCEVTPSN